MNPMTFYFSGPGGGTESLTSHVNKPDKSWVARQWGGFDTQYLKPLLTHSSPTLMDTLPNRSGRISRWEKLVLALKGYGTFMNAQNQFSPTCQPT